MNRLLTILTILVVFIAGIGLIGLAALMVQQQTKEMGVRKVIGAGVADRVLAAKVNSLFAEIPPLKRLQAEIKKAIF